jgi:DNA helicase II / ATP-dependent DNA helicase PcrA
MMNRTPQQLATTSHVLQCNSNLVVGALAGTGKTTGCIIPTVKAWNEPAVLVAFSKNIALEFQKHNLPESVLTKTFNALGFGSCFKNISAKVTLDTEKKKRTEIAKQLNSFESFPGLRQAYDLAREWGIAPRGAIAEPVGLSPDEPATYNRLFNEFDIDIGICSDPIGMLREALLIGIKMSWQGKLDFTDQKYMPAIYNWRLPQAPLVVVDEDQDMSYIDFHLVRNAVAPGGKIMAVGDEHQGIMGFRGADRQSHQTIIRALNATVLPLTVNFRCGRAIIREAQQYVPEIEAGLEHEGEVSSPEKHELEAYDGRVSTSILCRNNKPLVALFFRLISSGIPTHIRGRDSIGQGIVNLIRKTKQTQLGPAISRMWQNVDHQKNLLLQRGLDEAAALLDDKAACAGIIAERCGPTASVKDFERACDAMFDDSLGSKRITLSSIHKAKGLEWDHVSILDPWLMPSRFAKTPEARLQERNLQYVAVTRARQTLTYINSEGII